VRDALGAHGFEGAGIKWPNDILVGDRKLAGVLTEAVTRGGEISVVVGLGLNVNVSAAQVPDELAEIMTSLQIESGRRWDRMSLGLSLRDALLARCAQLVDEGLEGILEELRRHDVTAGRRVRTTVGEEAHEGRAQRIDDAGELIVELDDGSELSVAAGEVTFM
jgi:BirA family biotin operon repressor/biotin-[acetyl-CoA-carboxylase] ligase